MTQKSLVEAESALSQHARELETAEIEVKEEAEMLEMVAETATTEEEEAHRQIASASTAKN